jgi:hypothetical protein
MMTRLTAPCLLVLIATAAADAQPADKRTWRLRTVDGQSMLTYGTDNAEDTPITFRCKPGQGVVKIFINETGAGVKPRQTMTASLTAGSVTSKSPGKTLVNEEAGTPSFEGSLASSDPLFPALRQAKSLAMVVGPSRQQVPLRELGDKAEKFAGICGKR